MRPGVLSRVQVYGVCCATCQRVEQAQEPSGQLFEARTAFETAGWRCIMATWYCPDHIPKDDHALEHCDTVLPTSVMA